MRMLLTRFRHLGLGDQVMWLLVLLAAVLPALDVGLKFTPTLAEYMPHFMESTLWRVAPLLFLTCAGVLYLSRANGGAAAASTDEAKSLLPPPMFPKQRYHPPTEFLVLPLHVTVDLLGQPPEIRAQFYVFSFLLRPIKLIDVELAVRVNSLPNLEDVTCRQKDLEIEPKDYEVIVCRRQLTNAECGYQWKAGRASNADFNLTAKATDGEKTFTYGPVSSIVIDGWVNAATTEKQRQNVARSPETDVGFISLREGATRVYEELKNPPHIWTVVAQSHAQGNADAILDQMAAFITGKIALYGKQPPGTKIERLDVNEQTQVAFDGGAATMRFLLFRKPPCTDLQVKLAEVENLIESERGNFTPSRRG